MVQQGATVGARLEKAGQGWRRVRPYIWRGLLWGFVGLAVAGAILALYYLPKMWVPVCPPGKEGLPPKICFDIENEARKTLAYIMGGLLAIIGIYMAHRRIRALERQVLVAQEGQITERFTRAIEHLGSDKIEIRLGGIYALERIANDSDKDYWPIMETLTAYVRENAPWREAPPISQEVLSWEESGPPAPESEIKPATDLQAVLTVLGRRKYRYGQGESQSLDLRNTDLRGAVLIEAHLEGVIFGMPVSGWSKISESAFLEWAEFQGAHLKRAYLREANLAKTDLIKAHLEDAYMHGIHLEGALLIGSHLERANLMDAHLEGTELSDAHLEGAELNGTHLEWANLFKAIGITREQLAGAILNENTILPKYLKEGSSQRPKLGRKPAKKS